MTKQATKITRAAVLAALPSKYDAATVRISKDGSVTARIDCDVVPGSQHEPRIFVGYAEELVQQANA